MKVCLTVRGDRPVPGPHSLFSLSERRSQTSHLSLSNQEFPSIGYPISLTSEPRKPYRSEPTLTCSVDCEIPFS
ncbi:hypothetical protein ACOSQ4_009112 [Xanthoceras sorbifolium]